MTRLWLTITQRRDQFWVINHGIVRLSDHEMMQPYSELANWDGSLSAPDSRSPSEPLSSSVSHSVNIFRDDVPEMLDPLQTDPNPLPLSLHDPSIYNLYHKHPQTSDHHHQVLISLICYAALSTPADSNTRHFQASHTVAHPRPPPPHAPSASFDLPSSDTPFLSNVQDADVLSPQEREIMADITLDPDDPAAWATAEKGKNASGPFHNLHGEVRANILQVCLYLHQSAISDSLLIFFLLLFHFFPTLSRSPAALLGGFPFFFFHSFTPPMRQKVKIAVGHGYITAATDKNSRPTNTTTTTTATTAAPTCARRVNFGVRLSFAVCPTGTDHEIILIIAVSSCHQ